MSSSQITLSPDGQYSAKTSENINEPIIYSVREVYQKPPNMNISKQYKQGAMNQLALMPAISLMPAVPTISNSMPTNMPNQFTSKQTRRIKIYQRPKPAQYEDISNVLESQHISNSSVIQHGSFNDYGRKRKYDNATVAKYVEMLHECHQCRILFTEPRHLQTHMDLVHPPKRQATCLDKVEETMAAFILMDIKFN